MQKVGAAVTPFEELSPMGRRRHNMPLIAQRVGWPDGVAARLIEIDRKYPEWVTWFYRDGTREIPAASCAARLADPPRGYDPLLVAPDPDELAALIEAAEPDRQEAVSRPGVVSRRL